MSMKSKRQFGSLVDKLNDNGVLAVGNVGNENNDGDEDSMIELGQIALLSSSRASLRYRSLNEINLLARKESVKKQREDVLSGSKLLLNQLDEEAGEKQPFDVLIEDDLTFLEKLSLKILPFKGYLFGIMSAFSFSLSQVTMKRAKWLSGSDHSLVRYIVTLIVMFTVLKYKNLRIFGPKSLLKILIFRGFIGSCALITLYFAIMLINPSDAISIAHSSIIITAILGRIFLKEKMTMAHLIALILTVIGVLFICKPSFLFPKKETLNESVLKVSPVDLKYLNNCNISSMLKAVSVSPINNSQMNNSSQNNILINQECIDNKSINNENLNGVIRIQDLKTTIGILLTFITALASACVYLTLKKLSNSKVHWASNTIFVCWFGIPFSIIISLFLIKLELVHSNFELEKKDLPMDLFYSFLASCLSIIGQIFLNISLKYEDATKIAITKTIDVFFSYCLQYILLNIPIDLNNIIGAISIIFGTFSVLVFKILETKYDTFKKKESSKNEKSVEINNIKSANKNSNTNNETNKSAIEEHGNSKNLTDSKSGSFKKTLLRIVFVKF